MSDRNDSDNLASIDMLFHPRSVAVVGASADASKLGHRIVRNLVDSGFTGLVFPVHPRGGKILDLTVYRSVAELPPGVSLAVVCVPRQAVFEVLEQTAAAGVQAVVIVSSGFAEVDADGSQLQRSLADKAREAGLRIVGPNCVGIVNTDPAVRLNSTFCPLALTPGRVALASQSGALGVLALAQGEVRDIGFSQFVSVGNEADISAAELVDYWGSNDDTHVIALYLESISRAAQFRQVAQRISPRKPIVVIKAGREEAGGRAARSHTAAMTSNEIAVDAFLRHCGIIRAAGLDELLDLAALFAHQPLMLGRRVGIVTNAGGPAVLCADACADAGLSVPILSRALQQQLAEFIAPSASLANPIDMLASAGPAEYRRATEVLLNNDEVDAVVVIYVPVEMVANREFVAAISDGVANARSQAAIERPVVACIMSKSDERISMKTPHETIPFCTAPESAARMLGKAADYAEWQRRPRGAIPTLEEMDFELAEKVIAAALGRSADGWLPADSIGEIASALGLPMIASATARTAIEAVEAARRLGFPVALKTASAQILHKTDIGAVALDLESEETVRAAFQGIVTTVAAQTSAAAGDGVLVQPMCNGIELMIGAARDPQFGPLLAFGLGGTRVEVVRDICHRLAPLTDRDAADLVRSIRGYRLLAGYRGGSPADVPAIEELLLRAAQLMTELPAICELDLNPVIALPCGQGCRILDARIRVAIPSVS